MKLCLKTFLHLIIFQLLTSCVNNGIHKQNKVDTNLLIGEWELYKDSRHSEPEEYKQTLIINNNGIAKWIWTNQKESDTATYNWKVEKSKFRKADFDFILNDKHHLSIIKLNNKQLTLGKCEGQHPMKKLKYWYYRDWKKTNSTQQGI